MKLSPLQLFNAVLPPLETLPTVGVPGSRHNINTVAPSQTTPPQYPVPDNPKLAIEYEKWKLNSFGKSDDWKDTYIPERLKPFREFDKTVLLDLGIKDYSRITYVATPDIKVTTRNQIKAHYKETYGLDIDPDNTYLMTFAYNVKGHKPPYPGKIISKVSLTDAAIKNMQDTPGHSALPKVSFNKHEQSPPPIEIVDNLTIGYPRSSGRHGYQNSPDALQTQQYEGIYFEPPAEEIYDASTQAPISPTSFRKYVWDTSFSEPHRAELDSFWSANRDKYTTLTKMSFATAAHKQYEEGSLSREGRDMALQLANISANKPLESLTARDFQSAYAQNSNVETKALTFEGHAASGIFYVTDKTTNKTLLYMTGNSSPLHEFDNPAMMRKWLTEQMTDATKRRQFAEYFKLCDRDDTVWESGIDVHLKKTGDNSSRHTDWLEDRPFGGTPISGDPFRNIQARVEKYTYADSDWSYVSNGDVTKKNTLSQLKSISKSLLVLAPVGLAVPQVGMALLLFNLGIPTLEIGFGIDDKIKGRPGATDRITFGAFNAVQVVAKEGVGKVIAPIVKPIVESKIVSKVVPQIDPI